MPEFEEIEFVAADTDHARLAGELEAAPVGRGVVVCVIWDTCELRRERSALSGVELAEDIQKLGLSALRIERGGQGGIDGGDHRDDVGGNHGGWCGGRWLRCCRGNDGRSRGGWRGGRRDRRRSGAILLSGIDRIQLPQHIPSPSIGPAATAAATRPINEIRVVSPFSASSDAAMPLTETVLRSGPFHRKFTKIIHTSPAQSSSWRELSLPFKL